MTSLPAARVRTEVTIPVRFADGFAATARMYSFEGLADRGEHVALSFGESFSESFGEPTEREPGPVLVRVHSECLTGDVFGSGRCDCGAQLRESVERVAAAGGVLLYLRQEGRGIGLYAKLDAYELQDAGLDTYDANLALGFAEDARDYTVAAQMLAALGVRRVALLSNNPDKAAQLEELGIPVAVRVPTGVHLSDGNADYLRTKVRRHAHTLRLPAS